MEIRKSGMIYYLSILIVCVLVFGNSWSQVLALWTDTDSRYSHGLLLAIVIISLLLWATPGGSSTSKFGLSTLASIAVMLLSAVWFLSFISGFESVAQVFALLCAIVSAFVVLDRKAATRVALLLSILLTAMPIWDAIGIPMQRLTTAVVQTLLKIIGIPAAFDGFFVIFPAGVFEIAEGCNGAQMLISSLSLGCLYSWLWARRFGEAAIIIASFAVVGLLANWLRVFIVVLVGYFTDMNHYFVDNEHYSIGWLLFAIGIASLFYFYSRNFPDEPDDSLSEVLSGKTRTLLGRVTVAIVAVLIGPALLFWHQSTSINAPMVMPNSLGPWNARYDAHAFQGAVFEAGQLTLELSHQEHDRRPELLVGRVKVVADYPTDIEVVRMARYSDGAVAEVSPQYRILRAVETTGRDALILISYFSGANPGSRRQLGQFICGIDRVADVGHQCSTVIIVAACLPDCSSSEQDVTSVFSEYLAMNKGAL